MPMVSVDVGYVDVHVDLDAFGIEELIEGVEASGYIVLDKDDPLLDQGIVFSSVELELLQRLIDEKQPKIGSELYFLRERISFA